MSDMELMDRAKKNCTAVMSWKRKAQTCVSEPVVERVDGGVPSRVRLVRGPNPQRFQSLRLPASREVAVSNVVQTRARAARILMFFVHTHPQTMIADVVSLRGCKEVKFHQDSCWARTGLASSTDFCLGPRRRSVWDV